MLWLAPRLEAAGYRVFSDILSLHGGDRWRKQITSTLQEQAVKMLLCCRDSTLSKEGVQEEIGIGVDVSRELNDPRFIIPLRLEKFKKVFGIGELQYVDFLGGWASGLRDLLEDLQKDGVPRLSEQVINPNWENYKKRLATKVEETPENLTTNWLRIGEAPDAISFYEPSGALEEGATDQACRTVGLIAERYQRGFFCFAAPHEVNEHLGQLGRFALQSQHSLSDFLEAGSLVRKIRSREAQNVVSVIFRRGWEEFCRTRGFFEYAYSTQSGFHAGKAHVAVGKRIPWTADGRRRSSMVRNTAGGKVWEYGVSAFPQFWPFAHFRFKARVLFSDLSEKEAGNPFSDPDEQFRLRRRICKGWRNKAWHGRLIAFLTLLADGRPSIDLRLSPAATLSLDPLPLVVTSPVTTLLPDALSEDAEEQDVSTLGQFDAEETA